MPYTKEEVGRSKALLGWCENNARYSQWRGGVKAWARTKDVTGKRQAGSALWGQFKTMALAETGLPASGKRLLEKGATTIQKEAEKALDKILQDILKKSQDTERSHALSQVTSLVADTPEVQYDPNADSGSRNFANEEEEGGFHKSVRIFLVDPSHEDVMRVALGGQYLWDGGPSNCIAIMGTPSLFEVVDKVRDKIPAGLTVRAIFGVIANPTPPGRIPEAIRLQSDEEVEAFFDLTSAKPIRL